MVNYNHSRLWPATRVAAALGAALLGFSLPAAAKTRLVMATHFEAQQKVLLEQYIAEYQKLHPDVEIELQSIPFASYLEKIQVAHAAGVPADILHVYSLWGVQLVVQDMLARPPQDIVAEIRQAYVPGAVEGATINGEVWGYPTEVNNYLLVYNKRMFDEAGLPVPQTWDELVAYAKRLTRRGPGGEFTQAGFAFLRGWDSAVVHPWLALLYGEGGQPFAPGYKHSLLDRPEAVAALEKEVRLFREGVTDLQVELAWFPQGKAAMTIMAPWWEQTLRLQMQERFADVAVAPIPPGKAGLATVHYTWFFAVDKASKNQKAAWEFLRWLNGKQEGKATSRAGDFLVSLGIIPSRKIDIQGHPDQLMDAYTRPFVEAMAYSRPEPNVYRGQEIKTILMKEILQAWQLQKSPVEALLAAKRQVDPILAEYYR